MSSLTIKVGDELPVFQRRTGLAEWNRYAAVNDEFVPIHMDDDAGRAAGFPGALGMGNLQLAYLHNVVRDWLGSRGRILTLSCRFNAPNLKDTTIRASGRVTALTPTRHGIELALDVWTADGNDDRLAPGTCTVLMDI